MTAHNLETNSLEQFQILSLLLVTSFTYTEDSKAWIQEQEAHELSLLLYENYLSALKQSQCNLPALFLFHPSQPLICFKSVFRDAASIPDIRKFEG